MNDQDFAAIKRALNQREYERREAELADEMMKARQLVDRAIVDFERGVKSRRGLARARQQLTEAEHAYDRFMEDPQ